jgi:hypothetical protein
LHKKQTDAAISIGQTLGARSTTRRDPAIIKQSSQVHRST